MRQKKIQIFNDILQTIAQKDRVHVKSITKTLKLWFWYEIWNIDIIYIVFIENIIIIIGYMTKWQPVLWNEPGSQWQHPHRHVLHIRLPRVRAFPAMPDPRKAEKSYLQDHEQAKAEYIAIIFMHLSTPKIQYITYITRFFSLSYLWNYWLKMP